MGTVLLFLQKLDEWETRLLATREQARQLQAVATELETNIVASRTALRKELEELDLMSPGNFGHYDRLTRFLRYAKEAVKVAPPPPKFRHHYLGEACSHCGKPRNLHTGTDAETCP